MEDKIVYKATTTHKLVNTNFALFNIVVVTAVTNMHSINKADVIDKEQNDWDSTISIIDDVIGTVIKEEVSKVVCL